MYAEEILSNDRNRELLEKKVGSRPDTVDTIFDLRSRWNDEIVEGAAMGSYDPKTNIARLFFIWNGIPHYEIMASSGGSMICWNYSTYSDAIFGAKNISTISELPLRADVNYSLVDSSGEVVMEASQKGEVKMVDGLRHGTVDLRGRFFRDYKLQHSPGYTVYLKQDRINEIEAVYNQLQYGIDGNTYYNAVRRLYSYDGNNTLPFDEVMIFKVLESDFANISSGNRTDYVAQTTYYIPADYHKMRGLQ
jgi:hypothetical protein